MRRSNAAATSSGSETAIWIASRTRPSVRRGADSPAERCRRCAVVPRPVSRIAGMRPNSATAIVDAAAVVANVCQSTGNRTPVTPKPVVSIEDTSGAVQSVNNTLATAPAAPITALSTRSCRISRPRPAPRARRSESSRCREMPRASMRPARFRHAMSSTTPATPDRIQSGRSARAVSASTPRAAGRNSAATNPATSAPTTPVSTAARRTVSVSAATAAASSVPGAMRAAARTHRRSCELKKEIGSGVQTKG